MPPTDRSRAGHEDPKRLRKSRIHSPRAYHSRRLTETPMTRLLNASIAASASIQDAFERLNANQLGVVFTIDDSGRVVGCVTDGDIRRYLLRDQNLAAPLSSFMNRQFVSAAS